VLTRNGVAKRLGKSVATVRRLEGYELWPYVDHNGVHRFPEEQVRRLQVRLGAGQKPVAAQGEWLRQSKRTDGRNLPETKRVSDGASSNFERAAARQEVAETILNLLTPRQLRGLGPAARDYLEDILLGL
jgi:hypothetical protein